jgi:hypothetical protein
MMNEHTTKAGDVDLQEITRLLTERGGLADIPSTPLRGVTANGRGPGAPPLHTVGEF